MNQNMEFYAVCAASAILALALMSKYPRYSTTPELARHATTVPDIHAVLAPPNATLPELLHARAIPNARLIRAFNIHSTFVSSDPGVHTVFHNHSASLVTAATRRGWPQLRTTAGAAVQSFLPDTAIDFATYIQAVTFCVVIVGLLGVDVDAAALDHNHVIFVTHRITDLWRRSKLSDPIPPRLLEELNSHIRHLIPDYETFPNPLEFVIPAWETLWRVVAIAVAKAYHDEHARLALEDFHDNPTPEQFREYKSVENGPSVESVVVETMRLFPPTKHITRAVIHRPRIPGFVPTIIGRVLRSLTAPTVLYEVADIDAIQRSSIWGLSADSFDPMRHHPSRSCDGQKQTLLAFGYGQLGCVASKWAPMAAAVIVAAVLDRIDQTNYEVIRGDSIGGREGWDGWLIRRKE